MADDTLSWDLVARDRGASRTIKNVGDAAEKAGDQFDDAGDGAGHLSTQIDETTGKLRELGDEFDRTGDRSLLKDIAKERRTLAGLQRLRQEMKGFGDDTSDVGKIITQVGVSTGKGLFASLSMSKVLSTAGPAIGAAGAPIALGLTMLIGAGIAGGITAGISGGAIAAGIAGAGRDPKVQQAWEALASDADVVFSDFSAPFVDPTVKGIRIIRADLADVRDDMEHIGAISSTFVEPLAGGLGGFMREAVAGFDTMVSRGGPVIDMLSEELPQAGTAVKQFLTDVSSGSEGGADALRTLLHIGEAALLLTGKLLNGLAHAYEQANDLVQLVNNPSRGFAELVEGERVLHLVKRATDGAADSADDLKWAVKGMSDAYSEWLGIGLNADKLADDFRLRLLELNETIDQNGHSLSDNTEGGLRNQQVIRDMIDLANDQRQAEIDRAGGTEEAVARANAAYEANIKQIVELGVKAGLSRQDLLKLAGQYGINVYMTGLEKIAAQLRALASAASLLPGLGRAAAAFYLAAGVVGGALPRREGGITYARNGLINLSGSAGVYSAGSPLFGFAEPGTNGEAFVARNAPRARSLAVGAEAMAWHGASVIPNEQMGRGGSTTLVIESGGSRMDDLLVEVLSNAIQVRGGNVQVVLGQR